MFQTSSSTSINRPLKNIDDHQLENEGKTNQNIEYSTITTGNGFKEFRDKDEEDETFFMGSNEVWVEEDEEDEENSLGEEDHPLTLDPGNSEMTMSSSPSILTKMPVPRERIHQQQAQHQNDTDSQDDRHHQDEFDEDGNADDDEDEVEEIVRRMNEKLNASLNSSNVFSDCMQAMELCKEIIFMPIPSLEEENVATTSENMESSQQQDGTLSSHLGEQAPGGAVASLFNLFSEASMNSGSGDVHSSFMQQPLYDDSQEGFRLEDIEAELLRAAEKGQNTSTLYLQKINELTIIRNNMRRVLDTSIKKLRDESSSRNDNLEKSSCSEQSHTIRTEVSNGRNVSLFPDSMLQELQLGNVSLSRSRILTFDESIEIVSFIGGVIRMHSGVFPNRFLDNTRSLGTYLVGILHYYAQSINRTNFEVLIFEPNPEHFEWTKHNVNTFTKHLLKRNIFATSSFKSTVENVDFFAWLFDTKNDVRSSVVMLDLTPSCKEFDPSVVLKDLRIETETISRNANEMIEHMLYFGVCCVVLKVPCNYSEKQLSTHNKLWRIYVKIFGNSKYMIIFNYKPILMTGLSKHHGGKSDGNAARVSSKRQQR
ncbi:hypothetical protein C9374_013087 [Naegleria lovaniensis]|uniref:Uncharacterized protein n=1 Tax=Naegleria lovaniensis TaxID=51637 RepID=A0AA88GCA2_NAELO|nr:uncharacterized protein C9374_013087 [Naegleria lovaniensis]KAG2372880.1 hypothetical protein C9374_013087 [Naegleria lovaniensis]